MSDEKRTVRRCPLCTAEDAIADARRANAIRQAEEAGVVIETDGTDVVIDLTNQDGGKGDERVAPGSSHSHRHD